jgi:hypothetical protein
VSQRQVETATWRWRPFQSLSTDAKILYLYLLTGPQATTSGLSPFDEIEAAHHTGLDSQDLVTDAMLDLISAGLAAFSAGWSLTIHAFHNQNGKGWIVTAALKDCAACQSPELVRIFLEKNRKEINEQIERFQRDKPEFYADLCYSLRKLRDNYIEYNRIEPEGRGREGNQDAPGASKIDERTPPCPAMAQEPKNDQTASQVSQPGQKITEADIEQVMAEYPKRPRCRPMTGPEAYRTAARSLSMTGDQFRQAVKRYVDSVNEPRFLVYLDKLLTSGMIEEFSRTAPVKKSDPDLARQVKEQLQEIERKHAEKFQTITEGKK